MSKRTPNNTLITYWHCKCDCGNECNKTPQFLRTHKFSSCGKCEPTLLRDRSDLIGKRFGRLTVIALDEQRVIDEREKAKNSNGKFHTKTYWLCECDCGTIKSVRSDSLKENKILSCGCYHKEITTYVIPKLNWKTNKIVELEDSILIKSSNSDDYFRIDKEDYEKVKNYCWCSSHGYAIAPIRGEKNKFARMHRIVMNCGENEENLVVDHINHDITDNRKKNLRIATDTQNNWNSINHHNTGIKYKPNKNVWNVFINYNLQRINLGEFSSYDEAQEIRSKAEQIFYGEFQYQGAMNE